MSMLTVPQIVDRLSGLTRADFRRMFYQAQAGSVAWDMRLHLEGVTSVTDPRQALIEALTVAEEGQWLDAFLAVVIRNGFAPAELLKDYADRTEDARLHAMIDAHRGYNLPSRVEMGITEGRRCTAKVRFNGAARGTGTLIQPDLILTAWHTLRDAFELVVENGRPTYRHRKSAGASISFVFDDVLVFNGRTRPRHAGAVEVKAARDWCVCFSPCHSEELSKRIPKNRLELEHHWDYVIVRLAEAPGLERRWIEFDVRNVVPDKDQPIYILQHPDGQHMKMDHDVLGGPLDFCPKSNRSDIRFIHFANGDGGTSGAPCFDQTFSMFGIHQGVWPRPRGRKKRANRGIPVVQILGHIRQQIGELPPPDASSMPIWELPNSDVPIPVVGREDFQSIAWQSALKDTPRIIVLRGTSKIGKSFLLDVLSAVLQDKMHLKVEIPAESIAKADAPAFLAHICALAGIDVPELPEETNSSATVRRETLVSTLIEALEKVGRERKVWLLIRDINKTSFEGPDSIEMLRELCARTRSTRWLRIVLDGFTGDLPSGTEPSYYDATLPKRVDVERFFRRFAAKHSLNIDGAIHGVAGKLMKDVDRQGGTTTALATTVTEQALAFVEKDEQ